MSKAEEFAYSKYPKDKKGVLYDLARNSIIQGYQQAEKNLLENKHETSWRLDKKLWKGINDIEEASYQYIYDASNDWAYDIPTWKDVQDAFKAGSEWKENLELTWEDMFNIFRLVNEVLDDYAEGKTKKEVGQEVLKRFKDFKKEDT